MIYFDNAATGFPKHPACKKAICDALITCANSGRSVYKAADEAARVLFLARSRLAELFGAKPENVVLTQNATHALNLAIKGASTRNSTRKREIIISNFEHNAVIRPSFAAFESVKTFEVDLHDDKRTLKNFASTLSNRTSLVCFTYASNVCGKVLPVKKLTEIAKSRGLTVIVDASQAAGHFKIDLAELGADILCLPCHKGLYAPTGTGALIAADGVSIAPLIEGGTGTASREKTMPKFLPERLEAGTMNICGAAAIAAACSDFVYPTNEKDIFRYLLSSLKDTGAVLYGAPERESENYLPLIAFNMPEFQPERLAELLAIHGICVRAGLHCAPTAHSALGTGKSGCVRLSIGRYNTMDEAEEFMRILRSIAGDKS